MVCLEIKKDIFKISMFGIWRCLFTYVAASGVYYCFAILKKMVLNFI